ncbi:MAG: tRNA uridine-5-carboxymethylaminomethyl(34) synthesis GTPase MnmE [Xanthomonadaceae bacterium]|nr:tRNA uridine-5-carboxymethylaminomethyl(34) synthesis GTPase MnmE [Xanthomonadaceae bacterium]
MHGKSNYFNEDTIVALSGALGGAIATVRFSGKNSLQILSKLTGKSTQEFIPRVATRSNLFNQNKNKIDDSVVVFFQNPNSFTGEDSVEISIHASAYIAQTLISEIIKLGGRQALPGEFSFRAVRSGKITLDQAQAIPELIESKNQTAAELALEKMSGLQNKWVKEVSAQLRQSAMLSEIGIDFSDQDIEELELKRLKEQVKDILPKLEQVEKSFERGKQIQNGVPTAIIGMPNAGKSSFFNLLLGEDRSIVSEIAGTTRDVVRESITLKNESKSATLRLSDTAGIRKSVDQIESLGIEKSKNAASESELVICVVDSKNPEINQVKKILEDITQVNKRVVIVLNKSDLVNKEECKKLLELFSNICTIEPVFVSSQTGRGIDEVISVILKAISDKVIRAPGELVLTHINHLNAIRQSKEDLRRAINAPEYELFAADIRQCLAHLSGLIGETSTDDILGKLFSEFCIGK